MRLGTGNIAGYIFQQQTSSVIGDCALDCH